MISMFKQLKNFTLQVITGANIATIAVMLMIGYSDRINPVSHGFWANVYPLLPIFLVMKRGFHIFRGLSRPRRVFIPVIGYLLCYAPVRAYMPFNPTSDVPQGAIKVMSYNVWNFAGWTSPPGTDNEILTYLRQQRADILCLQEASVGEVGKARVNATLDTIYPYKRIEQLSTSETIALYSRYPILSSEPIEYLPENYQSIAYRLKIDGDTIIVINNHLESTGFSQEEKERFRTLVKGEMKARQARHESSLVIHKLAKASAKRAPQADALARYISNHSDKSIIVCGDFNDSPISYTHHKTAQNLTDCFIATGNGPGISYHRNGFFVRIDNIMCSKDWEPYNCHVDNKIKISDHYPIYCWLKRRAIP